MGQNHGSFSNPMLQDWHQHLSEQNVFVNAKTQEQAQCHLVILNKSQQAFIRKRIGQNHNFITRILYYQPVEKNKVIKDQAKFYVYTEKLYPISKEKWVPITSALSILKGFRRLSSTYGMVRITPNMIRINNKKQIKVWINQNVLKSQPALLIGSEEQMLVDIVEIIMEFDSHTGALMMKCFTINDAINNILHDMAIDGNKNQLNFSNRTSKNEDKARGSYNSQKQVPVTHKTNFRSTKQTEDDSLKPFNQLVIKNSLKKQTQIKNVQIQVSGKNYLHNVAVPKSPTYINIDYHDNQAKTINGGLKAGYQANSHGFNYSQQNNVQKQSSIQFNSSHPSKMVPTGRPYKPVEYRNQNTGEGSQMNYNAVSNQISSPTHEKYTRRQPEKNNQIIKNPYYPPERKSNINRNYLQRMETSHESDVAVYDKTKGSSQFNEKSEINTSRQFMEPHSFIRNRHTGTGQPIHNIYIDSTRTKTQQFYSSYNDNFMGNSPRLRTNYLQSSSQIHSSNPIQMPKQMVSQSIINPKNQSQTVSISQRRQQQDNNLSYKSDHEKVKEQANDQDSSLQEDRKKEQKLKQARKIKEQMSCLGIMSNNNSNANEGAKTLTTEKSARDLLIKQKIEQKNKKHEQLKSAITKLLSE